MMESWPLSSSETTTLFAVLDRIVPKDDYPSATELGVPEFIRRRFEARPELVDLYRAGLMVLDARGFVGLTPVDQDAVLADLEGHPSLATIIQHTIEGYYADPGNGGNLGEASWEMVGFRVTA